MSRSGLWIKPGATLKLLTGNTGSDDMGHYKSNLRDLEFNLFEVFRIDERLGSGPFQDMDAETARATLRELERLATGPLAESFADADRNPPGYDPKTFEVTLPDSLKSSFKA